MKNQLKNEMPEDTYSREVVGGSLWTGDVFGLFVYKEGIMETMLDCLKYEHFCFEELQSWGSRPLTVLADAMIRKNGIGEETEHRAFCNILWEKIHEFDEACKRLVKEESVALKAKREAAA